MINITVEASGFGGDRAHVAKAYLGESKMSGGVVYAYAADEDEARERLVDKLKSWAKENVK